MSEERSEEMSAEDFLSLCLSDADEATLCRLLEKQPELAKCKHTDGLLEGRTPLHRASDKGCETMARLLLQCGAEVSAQDRCGSTPLHNAAWQGHDGMTRLLLEHGAEVNAQNDAGRTPLQHCADHGHDLCARLLLAHGAVADLQDATGDAALHCATVSGHVKGARELLEHGANADLPNEDGDAPLHRAFVFDFGSAIVRLLLEHGADASQHGKGGWTPLHRAVVHGREQDALLLLQHANANMQVQSGGTPLHIVSTTGQLSMARLLIDHGADRGIKNKYGDTARDVAEADGKAEVVAVLDTYFSVRSQLAPVLVGLNDSTDSPLARFAGHDLFEPKVLSLVKCLLSGEENAAFEQLQRDARC